MKIEFEQLRETISIIGVGGATTLDVPLNDKYEFNYEDEVINAATKSDKHPDDVTKDDVIWSLASMATMAHFGDAYDLMQHACRAIKQLDRNIYLIHSFIKDDQQCIDICAYNP